MAATEELDTRFTYHPPTHAQTLIYQEVRQRARALADFINEQAPESRESALALTHLDEVVFWTNAAIARRSTPSAG